MFQGKRPTRAVSPIIDYEVGKAGVSEACDDVIYEYIDFVNRQVGVYMDEKTRGTFVQSVFDGSLGVTGFCVTRIVDEK